jgi:hypothetical protein
MHHSDATSTTNQNTATKLPRAGLRKRDMIGLCLRCGHRLTYCGKPFTAEMPCVKCLGINIYAESWQPQRLR